MGERGADDRAWGAARVAAELQELRRRAGEPSYSDIAARIARSREDRGMSAAASRVARSTVYDVFRAGRVRLNPALVADIVLALGEDNEEAERWRSRCASDPVSRAANTSRRAVDIRPGRAPATRTRAVLATVVLLALCVAANLVGGEVVILLSLPLFLDMVGTAFAAVMLGPWAGVAVAVVSHALTTLLITAANAPYTAVGIVGALLWGYGVRRWRMGATAVRFFALTVAVGVVSTLLAAPITVTVYGGFSEHTASDSLTDKFLAFGGVLWAAVFSANIVSSLIDKLVTGFIVLSLGPPVATRFGLRTDGVQALLPVSAPRSAFAVRRSLPGWPARPVRYAG